MKVDYLLTGLINDNYLQVSGEGEIDKDAGEFHLSLKPDRIDSGWDPSVTVLMCCDNLRLYSASMEKCSHELTSFREKLSRLSYGGARFPTEHRSGVIQDKHGKPVLNLKAKGFLFVENARASVRTVITEFNSSIQEFGGVREIITPYTEIVVPSLNGMAIGISRYRLITNSGEELEGMTKYPYIFNDGFVMRNMLKLNVHKAEVVSEGYRDGKNIDYRVGIICKDLVGVI